MAEARLFQALSDPTRLKIVSILARGPSNVTGIVNLVRAAQPAVSRHLRILREVGLIHDRRLGKEVEYSLDAERIGEARGWLGDLEAEMLSGQSAGEGAEEAPSMPAAGTYSGGGRRPRRISPLAARRGGVVSTPAAEEHAVESHEGVDRTKRDSRPRRAKGAGIRSGSKQGKVPVRAKPKARAKKVEGEKPAGGPAYVVRREDDSMEDFLL